jgi:tetratricopeptide (TPR) repeat protein
VLAAFLLLFATIVTATPPGFDETYRAGLIALQHDQLDTAEQNLVAASQLQPKNARVWVALAQTYRKTHADPKALQAAANALRFGASDSAVLQTLVTYYLESGDTLHAADIQARYESVQNDSSGRAAALYFEAAGPFLKDQKFAEALAILEAAHAKVKPNPQIELALGVTYYGLRRFDEAAGAFLRTISIAPEIEQPYLFLGRMLEAVPDRLPVLTVRFAEFEAAHPSDPRGYLLHAKALDAQAIEAAMARKLIEKSLAIDATNAGAHVELATLLERLRAYPEAAAEFERAATLDSRDAATHYHLARLYDRLNRPEDAAAQRQLHAQLTAAQDALR